MTKTEKSKFPDSPEGKFLGEALREFNGKLKEVDKYIDKTLKSGKVKRKS